MNVMCLVAGKMKVCELVKENVHTVLVRTRIMAQGPRILSFARSDEIVIKRHRRKHLVEIT